MVSSFRHSIAEKAAPEGERRLSVRRQLTGGNRASLGDDGSCVGGNCVVKECLGRGSEGLAVHSHQHEGTLHLVAAILDGVFAGVTPSTFRALTVSLMEARDA